MDTGDVLQDIVDAEFVAVGIVGGTGLLVGVLFTGFLPWDVVGVVYLTAVLALVVQQYRGVPLDARDATLVGAGTILALGVAYGYRHLGTPGVEPGVHAFLVGMLAGDAVAMYPLAFMLPFGLAPRRQSRALLAGSLVCLLPVLAAIDYQLRVVGPVYPDAAMAPGPRELLGMRAIVVGLAIGFGIPLYALGRVRTRRKLERN